MNRFIKKLRALLGSESMFTKYEMRLYLINLMQDTNVLFVNINWDPNNVRSFLMKWFIKKA
jgi:hypothetical protein